MSKHSLNIAGVVRACGLFAALSLMLPQTQSSTNSGSSANSAIVESPGRTEVEKLIRESGADVAVAYSTLDGTPQEMMLNENESFHAASTMKIPVMIELFAEAHSGKLGLDDKLLIQNEFHSIVDDSIYHLDPKDDSDEDVYKAIGTQWTLRQLCEAMITKSSNLATDLIIEKLGVANIQACVHLLQADGLHLLRGVEDEKAFQAGKNNTTTAKALYLLLRAIADHSACDPDSCMQMLDILERQTFNEAIPPGLPPGTVIAHKTGEITGIHHDAAIVFGRHPFVLVILVKGIDDRNKSSVLMAAITRAIYDGLPN
ncbi:MAG: serine hydrolase [Candidatus Acidiferrales bacterium]